MGWNLALLLLAKLCDPDWGCIGRRKGAFCHSSARVECCFVTCTKMNCVLEVTLAENNYWGDHIFPHHYRGTLLVPPTHLFTSTGGKINELPDIAILY